jgi:mono/diheme cytochrome c family protein
MSRLAFYAVMLCAWVAAAPVSSGELVQTDATGSGATPTFNRDIAPIVFANCVTCHHPGGIGPFSLTDYHEVKKHAELIGRVTTSRYMPPWLPEPGYGTFAGERRLRDEQVATIAQWVKAGAPEGSAADLKVEPHWSDDWRLGKPDLVVTMPQPYTLAADGNDVYRNFVIPNVVSQDRYVAAVEMRPGNPRVVHHAFIYMDPTTDARRLAKSEPQPGFPGMRPGRNAASPPGHFMNWAPGKAPAKEPEGMSWLLKKGSDFVLAVHMRPDGKPEKVQASIGLYFTDQPPKFTPYLLTLRSTEMDIPPGATDYAVETSYTLPIDVNVLAILPHAHYLGKEIHGWATLPGGAINELLLIKHWSFNWQDNYHYASAVFLPKGTTLHMRFVYDNSDQNPANPHHPPVRVLYGLQSTDEMAELSFQLLPKNPSEIAVLDRDFHINWGNRDNILCAQALLRRNPKDAESRTDLATTLFFTGKVEDAVKELHQAITDDPRLGRPHYVLGMIFAGRNDLPGALSEFAADVALEPDNSDSRNNYGYLLLMAGRTAESIEQFQAALRLNPDDALAKSSLERAKASLHN